ncbi:MAG: ISAs1 family transposase [Anaerolineae bacterium]|nr:ISAs1 family transposase [Anaerolineae bacterium]
MTSKPSVGTIAQHFADIDDPRYQHSPPHHLIDIITIAICGVICGADDWVAIEEFGQAKQEWFKTFLRLPNGIPSHDTFGQIFAQLDPDQFRESFIRWVTALSDLTAGEIIPIDGKTLRGSGAKELGRAAIHMISAWASQNRLVLGQVKVADKSNEITAIPELLRLLAIKGCIITIDAMGCQTEIASQIISQEADYVLALKDNHKQLHHEVQRLFTDALANPTTTIPYQFDQTVAKDHGRIEIRRCWTIEAPDYIAYLDPQQRWPGLKSVVRIETERRVGAETSREIRHYLASLAGDPTHLNHVIRTHWHIENKLHWLLDVAFREDDCRVRQGHAPENLAILRHIALNLLKQEQTAKVGIRNKRLKAGWDNDYLLKVLSC